MFLETTFTPNEEQKQFIDLVTDVKFVWNIYLNPVYPHNKNHITMIHPVLKRSVVDGKPIINSSYYYETKDIFDSICEQNNITVDKIYRMAFNISVNHPDKHGGIHVDHEFEHNNFVLYLNDFDGGSTYLFDDDENLTKEIEAKKNKAVFFQGKHAQGFCKPYQTRAVLVVTFGS